ncbi:MAG: class A beta-lactamase-related serine hydrolase [Candidatus Poribacteria bacterium]|nr:class A beta-lactamase-related serine hydrolase [Candidatus Poribacteria bacterium]
MNAIQTAISDVQGIVGLAAKHLDTGPEIRHNADTVFFTASTLKVPLLVELYRQVDQGLIDLNRRIELTDALRVPGSGVFKELASGLQPTLHDLALLMIIISDNTATDFLYNLVGRDNLNNTMQELGLTQTHIPMTCRELLFSIAGLDTTNPSHTYQLASERLKQQQFVLDADSFSEERSDVSSPDDMCRLLALIYRGDILSPSSREAVLDILKRQQLNTVIPAALPTGTEVAHKTGSYHSVRCDVGIVFSPTGPYTVAIMAKGLTGDRSSIDAGLAVVSRAVYDVFAG